MGQRSKASDPFCVLFAMTLLFPLGTSFAVPAAPFETHKERIGGRDYGIVTANGVDLFAIASVAEVKPPLERAVLAATSLNDLAWIHQLQPEVFTLSIERGSVHLKQASVKDLKAHVILDLDRNFANLYPGAQGNPERLGAWWLALLKDHVSLINGTRPEFTLGTAVGDLFQKLYEQLGPSETPHSKEEASNAVKQLTAEEVTSLRLASRSVPKEFDPERAKLLADVMRTKVPSTTPTTSPPTSVASAPEVHEKKEASRETVVVAIGEEAAVGDYRIGMKLEPMPPIAGREARVAVRVRLKTTDQPVHNAMVALGLQQGPTNPPSVRPKPVEMKSDTGEYVTSCLFQSAGKTTIHVVVWQTGVSPAAAGFTVEVAQAPKEPPVAEEPSQGGQPKVAEPSPSGEPNTEALRKQVSIEMTEAGLLRVNWKQTDPPPSRAVFILKNAAGEEFARQTDTTEPFFGVFKNFKSAKTIEVQLLYANGVSASVALPYSADAVH
ncbi:MAG: hypothetical protein HY318_06670 [Armatimonadetes bacterium]|nr:hypothetical protein [Armatimonadota bacterium]